MDFNSRIQNLYEKILAIPNLWVTFSEENNYFKASKQVCLWQVVSLEVNMSVFDKLRETRVRLYKTSFLTKIFMI